MDTKLTLKLNEDIIERAKKYARTNNTSLSKVVESYLNSLTIQQKDKNDLLITPLVESLSGVVDIPADFDYKNAYRDHISNKYS
ncbi:MAG: DUF6364 family protein [Bacteroidota bacterium]